ncbi:SCO family protein [Longimicrobium sp.]|uniref:SCO family protein n=1 Tax=Longimicrobium sp. TaxID=2029185 RepID=UPI002E312693|nr:SCO family protein [Longimicrobium sp.]HEX6037026.1 SCO family protein [Longimicrobium sp.]
MNAILRRAPLCAALLLAAACGPRPAPEPVDARPAASMPAASDFSVYDLESRWTDQAGQGRALASLAGRPQVLALVYTHCAHTCPAILAEFKRMEAALPAGPGAPGFVLVSIDPARDTPARLAEFAASARLDPARWTVLTGDDESVRELAALLRVRYRPEPGGEYSHANAYLVLDADGRIVQRQDGLGDPDRALATLRALAAR